MIPLRTARIAILVLLGFVVVASVLPGIAAIGSASGPVCGDGACTGRETPASCPADCTTFSASLPIQNLKVTRGEPIEQTLLIHPFVSGLHTYAITTSPELAPYVTAEPSSVRINGTMPTVVNVTVLVPSGTLVTGTTGEITVTGDGDNESLDVAVQVLDPSTGAFDLSSDLLSARTMIGGPLVYTARVSSSNTRSGPVNVEARIEDSSTNLSVALENFSIAANDTALHTRTTSVSHKQLEAITNGTSSLAGTYVFEVTAHGASGTASQVALVSITVPFYSQLWFRILLIAIILAPIVYGAGYGIRSYRKSRRERQRYLLPKLSLLPSPSEENGTTFGVGYLADTRIKAYMVARDFTTHALVAGSTGSGKSVTASVIVEEALNAGIPAVVFDPTSQWTGFLSRLKDPNILRYYPRFNMTPDESRSYRGLIFTPRSDVFDLDLDEYLNPGEVTVFNLANLSTVEYDRATARIIQALFDKHWEETPDLRLIIVFDEVHRLLDPACDGVGYRALIKAAREFRKWGLGLVMASQVSSDFKEAIGGNVLTEVQLNTKNLNDIHKVEEKYGEEFAKRVARQGVGVGLVQNPKYNNGKPYFINFRPPLHNPHKLSAEDLGLYDTYTTKLKSIRGRIDSIQEAGTDTKDLELDYNLASSKLKEGKFKMAEIYIQGIEEQLSGSADRT